MVAFPDNAQPHRQLPSTYIFMLPAGFPVVTKSSSPVLPGLNGSVPHKEACWEQRLTVHSRTGRLDASPSAIFVYESQRSHTSCTRIGLNGTGNGNSLTLSCFFSTFPNTIA